MSDHGSLQAGLEQESVYGSLQAGLEQERQSMDLYRQALNMSAMTVNVSLWAGLELEFQLSYLCNSSASLWVSAHR